MPKSIELVNGPCSGVRQVKGEIAAQIGIPVNEVMKPSSQGEPYAVAVYQRQQNTTDRYQFVQFQRRDNQPFEADFADGPNQGRHLLPQPPHFCSKDVLVPLTAEMEPFHGQGIPTAVAVYRSKPSDGTWRFYLDRIDHSGETLDRVRLQVGEDRALEAANQFYLSPNYSIYSKPPTSDHPQVFIEHRHRRAYVDEGIGPLVQSLWQHDFETLGSCQERPSGKAYVSFPVARQGDALHRMLAEAGIESSYRQKVLRLRNAKTEEIIEVESADVLFSPHDIQRITALLTKST